MTKAKLLEDDEELTFQPTIRVNEEFARRFEHNKRREELHRLQEKHPEVAARLARQAALEAAKAARQAAGLETAAGSDEDEEESSSDDDDDEEVLENDDTDKVLETLVRIKKKDPVVFQKDAVLFPDPEDNSDDETPDGEAAVKGSKGSKKMYLRTVLAQQALEGGAAASSDDDDAAGSDEALPRQPVSQSYAAEQQELKQAFLQAAAEAEQGLDDEKGGLKAKKRATAAGGADADAGKEVQVNGGSPEARGTLAGSCCHAELLDEYFGKDEELTAADAFLKSYLANRAWKPPADGPAAGGSRKRLRGMDDDSSSSEDDSAGDEADDDEDEQFLESVDRFEAAYNFRYEEPGSTKIQSFPRVIEDSVRRPDERRKRQRQAKAERLAAEKEAREAELRRLKNLKKEEISSKLGRIQEAAGIKAKALPAGGKPGKAAATAKLASLMDKLLEGDFDPEEYDRRMAEAFDDEYYEEAEEAHELFGDAEEELADAADVEAVTDPEAAAGFAALRQKLKQQEEDEFDSSEGQQDEHQTEAAAGSADPAAAKAAKTAALAEQRNQLQRLLEDYYQLDYEDNIGGLPCRFKYREVPAESFGLTDDDIFTLSDKQLNQIAGLRLIAPYREDSKRLRPNYKALQTIKGEAAAKAALRQQKKDREKWKQKQKKQQAKQQGKGQQQDEQPQQQEGPQQGTVQNGNGGGPGKQQQQFSKHKQKFQQHGRHGHQQQQQHRHKQQQKPLTELSAEEKQAARLASYAKLALKPSKEAQQRQQEATTAGDKHKSKKRKADQQGGAAGEQKRQQSAQQPGRLASVQVDVPLTKAQRKNMLRTLKRKEKQQQQKAS